MIIYIEPFYRLKTENINILGYFIYKMRLV